MISIIFCGDLKYCPYLSRYTDRMDALGIEYEVLFWNRGSFSLDLNDTYKYFDFPSAENKSKTSKVVDFIRFRYWVKKQLSISNPQGIIFLSTLSGVILFDIANKYKNKYVFDIRDYSYEHIAVFKTIESTIIHNSFFTSISSKGFQSFLPDYDYVIAHNISRKDLMLKHSFEKQEEPLKIVWNGTVRFFDYQKQYLDVFGNDSRFIMIYHGAGTDLEKYKQYCIDKNINNVCFTGIYDNNDKYLLIKDAAFLNNCYGGRNGDELKHAISNRFYDGLIFHIPQIVENNSYKAKVVDRFEIGLSVEPTKDLPDALYEYYNNLNNMLFDKSCNEVMKAVLEEDDYYIKRIDDFLIINGGIISDN